MEYPPASIVAISIALPCLAVVAVCLRFWVRIRVQPSHIGPDDWLIVGAVILAVADGANLAAAAIKGIQGRSYPDGPPVDRALFEAKSDYAQVILEKPLYGMMKLSVLFFFRRIFLIQERWRIANNILIVLVILWCTGFFFADIFTCGAHPKVQWAHSSGKSCVGEVWLNEMFAITDVIGDILVVAMPYPCIKNLKMGKREKAGIAGIFLLGTLSTAASIVRLYFISVAFHNSITNTGGPMNGTPPGVWSTVEASIGVFAACLPPLGPLIRRAPNPHKASVSLINKITSRSSERRKSSSGDDSTDRKSSRPTEQKASVNLGPPPIAHSHIVHMHRDSRNGRNSYIELDDRAENPGADRMV